jgi:hypothetical protein
MYKLQYVKLPIIGIYIKPASLPQAENGAQTLTAKAA